MKPAQLRIVPTTSKVTDGLKAREDYIDIPGATPTVGATGDDVKRQDVAVVGNCDRFDLSKESDRAAYAELSAKLFAGNSCIRLWEERTQTQDALIVYVSYINYTNVYQSTAHTIDLKD
jgi:hypothetical protein